MSKRDKKAQQKPEIEKQSDYYRLKTKAVDDLINANEENSPVVSEEELRYYRSGPKFRVADWVKLAFIKFWFPASACYFFFWGLGGYLADQLDLLFVTAIALGMVTDLLTNNVLRYFEKSPGANDRWMMFPKKGYASFPLNILYAFLCLYAVMVIYNIINVLLIWITGATDTVPLGVEPVFFGLIYMGVDMMFIQIKHLFTNAFARR